MLSKTRFLLLGVLSCSFINAQAQNFPGNHSNLLVVIENLRPEFVSASLMPNVYKLSKKGVFLNNHHAVFPPLATVNAASIITGTNPAGHGITGDTIIPDGHRSVVHFDATSRSDLRRFEKEMKENPMTALSLSEIAAASSKTFLTICATSSGVGYLLNPSSFYDVPTELHTITERNSWAVDAYLNVESDPDCTILWLGSTSPMKASDAGSKEQLHVIHEIDEHIGRILKAHRKRNVSINVFVTSSGGIVTTTAKSHSVSDLLVQYKLKESSDSTDVIVIDETSIYVRDSDINLIRRIVERLQYTDWVGSIYTQQIRRTHPEGKARGALSFQSVFTAHKRSPDIFIEPAWSEKADAQGYAGIQSRIGPGAAPTSGTYALQIPLIASGPDLKTRFQSMVPTANSDLGPTLCLLMGLKPPQFMSGRILHEILKGGPGPNDIEVLRRRHGAQVELDSMTYRLFMTEFTVDQVDYLHSTTPQRFSTN